MAENQIRLSQLIGYYGPGAMLDLPDRSVLVMGLDDWDQRGGAFRLIEEPRLSRLLRLRLEGDSRLATSGDPQLRTPPLDVRDPRRPSPKIRATIFPRWFVCDTAPGDPSDRRRLVRFKQLEAPKRLEYRGDDGKRRRVSPIRFVCGCEDGHLQDVDWHRVVHQNAPGRAGCQEPLWLEDGGTTGDPRQTRVYCECGASLSLNDLFQPGRLGQCRGDWPWIDSGRDPNGCQHMLRLLTRSATNTYFPQVTRVISLPASVDQLAELVRSVWSAIQSCSSVEDVKQARRFNPQVAATLDGYPDEEVWTRIAVMQQQSDGQQDQAENPRLAEFATLASGQAVIGTPTPDALLHAETLPRVLWDPDNSAVLRGISSLVAVHRLREVACLYGFTRFEPAPVVTDELEDVGLAVRGAPLARNPAWLPAVEQFGEGLFLTLEPNALRDWGARAQDRLGKLDSGADRWLQQRRQRGESISDRNIRDKRRPEYVLAHSLAHALITEVAIDCGYPASSIRERIYVVPAVDPTAAPAVGILIYTASAGNQGTLGGLVEVSRRFAQVLGNALERQRLCSGDPVCADHDPATAADDRALHGAACHGCLVIAETSCEAQNLFLDRALLIDTVGPSGVGYFLNS